MEYMCVLKVFDDHEYLKCIDYAAKSAALHCISTNKQQLHTIRENDVKDNMSVTATIVKMKQNLLTNSQSINLLNENSNSSNNNNNYNIINKTIICDDDDDDDDVDVDEQHDVVVVVNDNEELKTKLSTTIANAKTLPPNLINQQQMQPQQQQEQQPTPQQHQQNDYNLSNSLLWQPWRDLQLKRQAEVHQMYARRVHINQETRLTAKELPTTKWRRERRLRAGEYTHTGSNNNSCSSNSSMINTNASPPCSPGSSSIASAGQHAHYYPHAARFTPLHYQTPAHHHNSLHAATTSPALLPMQAANSLLPATGPASSISSPSPSPTSSTSSSSQTSLMMTANMRLAAAYAPQAHRSNHTSLGSPDDSHDDQQSLERPLDMTVSSALLKQRNSPPPPYREPLPGSSYMTALARPSVITQAPPKRKDDVPHNNNSNINNCHDSINESNSSVLIKAHDNAANSMCENVIDEHFRRSLGADYLALFAASSASSSTTYNTTVVEAPLQLTINKTITTIAPPPLIPTISLTAPAAATNTTTATTTPPIAAVSPDLSITENSQDATVQLQQAFVLNTKRPQPPPLATDVPIKLKVQSPAPAEKPIVTTYMEMESEPKRYGKLKAAYLQKNHTLYKNNNNNNNNNAENSAIATTTNAAASAAAVPLCSSTKSTTPEPAVIAAAAAAVPKTNSSVPLKSQQDKCNITKMLNVDELIVEETESHMPLPLVRNKNKTAINEAIISTATTTTTTAAATATTTGNTTNATVSMVPPAIVSDQTGDVLASIDDHFAKALGHKWMELQKKKNTNK